MRANILLIGGSESAQESILEILQQQKYTVVTASNGADGLDYMAQHHCDLILLEHSLPDTDGLSLLQKIVRNHTDVPVIMMTDNGSEGLAVGALKNGASDYLTKSDDFVSKLSYSISDNLEKFEMKRRNWELENQLRSSYKRQKELNRQLEEKVQQRTEELERAYQLSNELMAKAVDSNMQLAELYTEVDEARRRLDAKIRELSLLNDIGKTITMIPDRDELLQLTLSSVYGELGIEHCAILLIDEDTQRLQIGVSYGRPDDLLLAAKPLAGDRILWDTIKKDVPLLIQDVEFDEQLNVLAVEYPGLECLMLVPMRIDSCEIGIFTVYGFEHNATFTQDDLNFIVSLAGQVSISLSNIRFTSQRVFNEQMKELGQLAEFFHDQLKPSLQRIRGVAEELDGQHAEDSVLPSQALSGSVTRIEEIFDGFRRLSQNEKSILAKQRVPVTEFLEEMFAEFDTMLEERQIHVHRHWAYNGNFFIDREKMAHVFRHLTDYACHIMPNGGNWTVSSRGDKDALSLEFTDDGDGMPSETLAHFFNPFIGHESQYDCRLSMSLARKILEEHHAQIDIRNAPEKGTTIRIVFPLF
ncbi:hypothetical protein CSB45_02100 [candidate division KSB3 bacterium]|uniref:Response regulatory domain-containing protein n=1 Tax=candidate division KSB3 bacterium TaxID=2044937 RepID=A0A2G6E9P5_9BACT|nr:MAG: hypothetical protein CSB45_02100 [candidate division KSB3 bacterium]PIE30874.1 MAG: hypothetical protein CSA57_00710 [candidate division KSB3 bacterium]